MVERRSCPVCLAAPDWSVPFLEKNVDPARMSEFSFASRKVPEFMCWRLVRCARCDTVYADQPPAPEMLAHSYAGAAYDSALEAEDAARTYIRIVEPALRTLESRASALEIGAGTGVFLDYLRAAGFGTVVGVEPSDAAIAQATPAHRAWIRHGMFDASAFDPASFDLVCCFMTLEHVRDPGQLARSVLQLLRPGGVFIVVTHDWRAPVNRLLGRRSPIIDIEHLQLFSRASLCRLYEEAGFSGTAISAFRNSYALAYWLRLMPLPAWLRRCIVILLSRSGLATRKLSANVGNIVAFGTKPSQA